MFARLWQNETGIGQNTAKTAVSAAPTASRSSPSPHALETFAQMMSRWSGAALVIISNARDEMSIWRASAAASRLVKVTTPLELLPPPSTISETACVTTPTLEMVPSASTRAPASADLPSPSNRSSVSAPTVVPVPTTNCRRSSPTLCSDDIGL